MIDRSSQWNICILIIIVNFIVLLSTVKIPVVLDGQSQLIQNRELPINFRLATALVFSYDIQRRIQKQQKEIIFWLSETISAYQLLEHQDKQWFVIMIREFDFERWMENGKTYIFNE